ncbi:MAG: hypothetical protein K0S61_48 [Anaerocolumna sp.]|nr:hypothetical protein [Anaerocolumna sp.]
MSNLIKSRYVYVKEEEKKIIDSNNRIEELRSMYAATLSIPINNLNETKSTENNAGGFVEGLHFQVIETVETAPEVVLEDPEQIINDAKLEAERILEDARTKAREESVIALNEASQKGYEEGHKKAMAESDLLKEELKAKEKQMKEEFDNALMNLEPEFAEIVSLLVEKITGIYVQDKKDIILHLLHKAMIHADNSKEYHIKVSSEDYELVLSDREILLDIISKGSVLEIGIDKNLEKNQCVIEMDNGIVDCSLDAQFEALKQDLKLLSMQTE